jgi:hypothetical protein
VRVRVRVRVRARVRVGVRVRVRVRVGVRARVRVTSTTCPDDESDDLDECLAARFLQTYGLTLTLTPTLTLSRRVCRGAVLADLRPTEDCHRSSQAVRARYP